MPLLNRLQVRLDERERPYIDLIRRQLESTVRPLARRLTSPSYGLTAIELEICGYIRQGLSSRQIARLSGTSVETVGTHRRNIRRKLRLTTSKGEGRSQSLRMFLNNLDDSSA